MAALFGGGMDEAEGPIGGYGWEVLGEREEEKCKT